MERDIFKYRHDISTKGVCYKQELYATATPAGVDELSLVAEVCGCNYIRFRVNVVSTKKKLEGFVLLQ